MEEDADLLLMLFSSSIGAKHLVYSYLYFDEEYVIIFTLILYILTFIGRDILLINERINMIVLFMNL